MVMCRRLFDTIEYHTVHQLPKPEHDDNDVKGFSRRPSHKGQVLWSAFIFKLALLFEGWMENKRVRALAARAG